MELLLGGQCKNDFMRSKKIVTKSLVISGSNASIVTPRGITEDSFKMTLDKFKNQALKDFIISHQVNYLWQNLHKLMGVTTRAYVARLQDISNHHT